MLISRPASSVRVTGYGATLGEAEEQFVAQAREADRLVVHERDQSALVVVEGHADSVQVEPGRLHRVAGSVPAVRFRQGVSAAYLATRTPEDRDRIAGEIAAEIAGR